MKCQKYRKWMGVIASTFAVAGLSAGCRLIMLPVVAVVAVVGMAGYTVYKGGEYAVTGIGSLASSGADAVASASKTVVFSGGEFRAECPGNVKETWWVANEVLRKANFQGISGDFDIRSGELRARTRDDLDVRLKLKMLGDCLTEIRLRIGVKGDLSTSETLFNQIREELAKRAELKTATAPKGATP